MNLKKNILLFLFISLSAHIYAQPPDTLKSYGYETRMEKYISILIGYNQWNYGFAEIGLAKNQYGTVGVHPSAWAYFLSSEIKVDDKLMIGPKLGAWIGGGAAGMALGISMIYYTDLNEGTLRLRPEIGIGFDRFKMVYGYNILLANKDFEGINRHVVSLAYLIGVKKLNVKI